MTSTHDGGFIVSGVYVDRTYEDAGISLNGMLIKFDSAYNGTWVLQYKHNDSETGDQVRSFLFDVKELPSGDIVATGNVSNIPSDLWIIKTNSEGCIGDDDCGDITDSNT